MNWRELLPKFHPLHKEPEPEPKKEYSLCETVTAGPQSKWHIRPLTEKGRKLGGGADTLALCGVTVSWDLSMPIQRRHLSHCCSRCAATFYHETRGDF